MAGYDGQGVGAFHHPLIPHHLHLTVQLLQPGLGVADLPVEVTELHLVMIHQAQSTHPGPCQVQSSGAAQSWS